MKFLKFLSSFFLIFILSACGEKMSTRIEDFIFSKDVFIKKSFLILRFKRVESKFKERISNHLGNFFAFLLNICLNYFFYKV